VEGMKLRTAERRQVVCARAQKMMLLSRDSKEFASDDGLSGALIYRCNKKWLQKV
jgi:hypothetical protein